MHARPSGRDEALGGAAPALPAGSGRLGAAPDAHSARDADARRAPWPSPQKHAPDGVPTESAHPARFSPDDKFSRERITCKKRFNLLPTQQPPKVY